MVTVHRATNLLSMDSNGFSDPFVKLCLIENVTNNHRQRVFDYSITRITARKLMSKKVASRNSHSTTIKWKTLNPEWNEEFAFTTRLTDLMKLTLCLTVWDKDFGKSNDYLGKMSIILLSNVLEYNLLKSNLFSAYYFVDIKYINSIGISKIMTSILIFKNN